MPAHSNERPMNRTTHLQARSAFGAAWLSARGIGCVVANRSAGQPAPI